MVKKKVVRNFASVHLQSLKYIIDGCFENTADTFKQEPTQF